MSPLETPKRFSQDPGVQQRAQRLREKRLLTGLVSYGADEALYRAKAGGRDRAEVG